MNLDISHIVQTMHDGNYTCVLVSGDNVFTSAKHGVSPLLECLESNIDYQGCYAADRVIGRGAAFLYVLLKAKRVYADVISKPALQILNDYQIEAIYVNLVDYIFNRTNDGFCPIEQCVLDIYDPNDALCAIKNKLKTLAN